MNIVTVFNNILKEVKPASRELENIISHKHYDWSEQKIQDAIKIVRQLQEGDLLITKKDEVNEWIDFRKLTIEVIPEPTEKCKVISDKDIDITTNYIEELVDSINKFSPVVKFFYVGYVPKTTKIIYYIGWEI